MTWSLAAGLVLAAALGCASAPRAQPSPLRADAEQSLATARTAWAQRHWSAAATAFGRAGTTFAAIGDDALEAAARRDEAQALRRAGDPAAAERADQRALGLDRSLGHRQDVARDLVGLARSAAALGDTGRAIGATEEALAIADADTPLIAVIENDLAVHLVARGDPHDRERARELLDAALAANLARGDALGGATNELNLARAALVSGEPDVAAAPLERALAGFRGLEDPEGLALAHELLAALHAVRGDGEQACFHRERARAGFAWLDDRAALQRLDAAESRSP